MAATFVSSLRSVAFTVFLCSVVLAVFFLSSTNNGDPRLRLWRPQGEDIDCHGVSSMKDHGLKCSFVKAHGSCVPEGFVNYLQLFYCHFGDRHWRLLGYALAFLWLSVLFYLLGNTASDYFCSSLEGLSVALHLPPTVAGVTLLSLGNGAPDVFSSVVSFATTGNGDVGISSVLGGALFVSTVVVGLVSITGERRSTVVDRSSFVKNVCFLLVVVGSLGAILAAGKIYVANAVALLGLYVAYVAMVSASHCCREKKALSTPLLGDVEDATVEGTVAMVKEAIVAGDRGDIILTSYLNLDPRRQELAHRVLLVLSMPLSLPRRLTIPDISDERWSKGFAVVSAALSPPFAALLFLSQDHSITADRKMIILLIAAFAGAGFGVLAMAKTESAAPPRKGVIPWLAAGFLMSVIWSYLIARELVALLVSIGYMLGIKSTVLGVTVLAWGNSIGDLVADLALAVNGGPDGAQIAISGCYAGPLFNTAVGLGLSLALSAWRARPAPFVVPGDAEAMEILRFLAGGLLFAVVVLPLRGMKLDRVLGFGLLGIYFCFLCVRLSRCFNFFI